MTWVQHHVVLMPFFLWDMVMIWTFVICEEKGNDFFPMGNVNSSLFLCFKNTHLVLPGYSFITNNWLLTTSCFSTSSHNDTFSRLQKINNRLCSKFNTWQITFWLSYQWIQTLRFMHTHLNRQDVKINMWGEWWRRSFCWKFNKITT